MTHLPRTRPRSRRRAAATLLVGVVIACASIPSSREARPELWGFAAYWSPASAASVREHGATLDVVIGTWIALDSITGAPELLHAQESAGGARQRMALLTSWRGTRFHPAAVRALAGDAGRMAAAMDEVARRVRQLGHRGVVVDFEGHEPRDLPLLRQSIAALSRAMRAAGAGPVAIAIPATDTASYPARALLDAGADFIMPMLYDQHWAGGAPGPVAAPAWVRAALGTRVREVGADRVVAALPLYGYRWAAPGRGETVTWTEARTAAASAGTALVRDTASATLRARFPSGGELWVTDAVLLDALLAIVAEQGVRRVALWHLGQEDPAAWPVLARARR